MAAILKEVKKVKSEKTRWKSGKGEWLKKGARSVEKNGKKEKKTYSD